MADGPTEDAGAQSPAPTRPIDHFPPDPTVDPAGDLTADFPGRGAALDGTVLRGIDWRATFPFVHLFRGFRVAIHPSKLLLALAAVLIIYTIGRSLDGVWADRDKAYPGEIEAFDAALSRGSLRGYGAERDRLRAETRDAYNVLRTGAAADAADKKSVGMAGVKSYILKRRAAAVANVDKDYKATVAAANKQKAAADKVNDGAAEDAAEAQKHQAELARQDGVAAAYQRAEVQYRRVRDADGRGPFIVFYDYESDQLNVAAASVPALDPFYAIGSALRFVLVGPAWLMIVHPLYFVIFASLSLAIIAIFGGAISRIAAVDVARDEKISIRQSLKFSAAKFLSFLSAPLVPAVVFIGVGLAVAVAGLLTAIPYVGPIVVGAGFFLALLAGLLMTLILIGTIGGFGMMYPTIAAEGSDSFDAISRSFSYLYARPWRFIFYTLVSLIYGALTYLFVKLFLYLVIRLALASAGALLPLFGPAADGANRLAVLAPGPASPLNLAYDIPFLSLNAGQDIGAFFIAFWVYLVVGLTAAFVLSLYFSLNTIIYYLMRAEVDATDPDEVYLEPGEDEFADTPDPLDPTDPQDRPLAASQSEPKPVPAPKVVEVGASPTEPEQPMAESNTAPEVPHVEPGEPMADRTTDPEPADTDDSTPMVDPEAPKQD